MCKQDRSGIGAFTLFMDKVNIDPVYCCFKMVKAVELFLLLAPVILIQPVIRQNQLSGFSNDPYLPSKSLSSEEFKTQKDIHYEKEDPLYHYQRFVIHLPEQ